MSGSAVTECDVMLCCQAMLSGYAVELSCHIVSGIKLYQVVQSKFDAMLCGQVMLSCCAVTLCQEIVFWHHAVSGSAVTECDVTLSCQDML